MGIWLRTIGISLLILSCIVTLAAVGYFTVTHKEPIDIAFALAILWTVAPYYAFWRQLEKQANSKPLIVAVIFLSAILAIYFYMTNIFFDQQSERVLVFGLVPLLQLVLYLVLWMILKFHHMILKVEQN